MYMNASHGPATHVNGGSVGADDMDVADEDEVVDDDDDGGDGDGDGDDEQTACTTPEIITSICNAYITLAASSSSSSVAVATTATSTTPELQMQMQVQTLTPMPTPPKSSSMSMSMSSDQPPTADSNVGSCVYCSPMSQCQCHGNGSSSSVASDSPPPPPPPPSVPQQQQQQLSVEAMRSHLIKESLKVTIQCKRLASGQQQLVPFSTSVASSGVAQPSSDTIVSSATAEVETAGFCSTYCFKEELTPEDQERRRRRRERNKVAATKCRNKKKERTVTLLMESDLLEHTNSTLRTEIHKLEVEKQRLLEMLNYHIPACPLQSTIVGSSVHQHQQQQQEHDLQRSGHTVTVASQQQLQLQRLPHQSSQYAEGMRCSQVHEIHGRATMGFRDNSMSHRIT